MDWTALGRAARVSANDAHEGLTPDVSIAYSFLLDNADYFVDGGYVSLEGAPSEPPAEFVAAYYGEPAA